MTIMSLADGCRLLAIDPKTLRRWLGLAHLSVQTHPSDTRLKCVTSEQLQHVAAMHHRTLPAPSEPLFVPTRSDVGMAPAWSSTESEISEPLTALTQQLGSLASQVAMLQHQLVLLTEQLQKEFQWRTSVATRSAESSLETTTIPVSIDRRKHPRVLPLVEYGAQGRYVVISPDEGLLSLEPDSPEWFAWLATLPSFRFVGRCGRFTAFRGYQSIVHTSWWAHRQIHNHSQRRRLGLSTSVTIECLELAASSLQALAL